MNKRLERLLGNVKKAHAVLESAVDDEQKTCRHASLEECDYWPSKYGDSTPPMRVCCDCGMSEEGWGPGYVVLKGEARTILRESLYAKRHGLAIRDHHKGPLLRREVTIADLIDDCA